MTQFSVYGHNMEGKLSRAVFPYQTTDITAHKALISKTVEHLAAGNSIHIEFTDGARKGTIARWAITAEEFKNLYCEVHTGRGKVLENRAKVNLVFDDRPNVISINILFHDQLPGIIHFHETATVWAYTTKSVPKKPPLVVRDHFGVVLAPGQLILFPMGPKGETHTRFGHIVSITPAGTVKVEAMATRQSHGPKVEVNISPTVNHSDIIVLDDLQDIKNKVVLAKLANA